MTLATPIITEKDIARAVRVYLEAQGLKVRAEVPVVLPDHGLVTADLVACKTDETGEWFTVVECKRRLDETLEAQAKRWLFYANSVAAAYIPSASAYRERNQRRIYRVDYLGIGRFLYVGGTPSLSIAHQPAFHTGVGIGILSQAFHASTGEHDPAAGSAAAKRMTGDRCLVEKLRDWIKGQPEQAVEFPAIRREFPNFKSAHQVRKLCIQHEDIGVVPVGHARTLFCLEVDE